MAGKGRLPFIFCLGILLAVCLTGCGQKDTEEKSSAVSKRKESGPYDLLEQTWHAYKTAEESPEAWGLTDYRESYDITAPEGTELWGRKSASDGQRYYDLASYVLWKEHGQGTQQLYLTCADMLTMEIEKTKLHFAEDAPVETVGQIDSAEAVKSLNNGTASVVGMDVVEGKLCLLAAQYGVESKELEHTYAVWLNAEYGIEKITDLTRGMEDSGLLKTGMPQSLRCDGEGRYYVEVSEIAVLDSEGAFFTLLEAPEASESMSMIFCTGRLSDGTLLFEYGNRQTQELILFCLDGKEEKILCRSPYQYVENRYLNDRGEIFFIESGEVFRWNAAEGSCESLYQNEGLFAKCRAIAETPEGGVALVMYDGEAISLCRLEPGAETEATVVTIYQMYEDQLLEQAVDEYTKRHPGVKIEITSRSQAEEEEIEMNKLAAQLSGGEGPDLLLLEREQMLLLAEKGALADLSQLLDTKVTEQIFPAALQYGTAGDKLCGLVYQISVSTLAVSEELCRSDTWSFRDVMELLEAQSGSGKEIQWMAGNMSPQTMLSDLVLKDVAAGNSSLVDAEGKQCYFDTEEFVRLLEFCRKYGNNPKEADTLSREDAAEQVRSGKALAYRVYGNLTFFSSSMENLGEGFKCIGYPTEGGNGSFVNCGACLCVNGASENGEIACDFLQFLMEERIQRKLSTSTVRRDILSGSVVEHWEHDNAAPAGSASPVVWRVGRTISPLGAKPDGTSFLPEYTEILEKGITEPKGDNQLIQMILEEAQAYFYGDKSAEDAAEIIQNRVSLYLNE